MTVEGASRRHDHFARNHLAWIVIRHFLPADLLEELGHAIVEAASGGRIAFATIFDTARSGGPSALASWAVRPRPTGSAFEAYLQRLIIRLVWQGDQTAGRSDHVIDPNEVAAMDALEVALAVSPVDFESIASLSAMASTAPGALQVLVSAVARLSRLPPDAGVMDLEPVLAGGILDFEGPLDAAAVKFLGDLCADADRWEAAASLYQRAVGLVGAITGSAWAELTQALQTMLAQSRAAALGTMEGPGAADGILGALVGQGTLGSNLLASINAVPDEMTARSGSESILFVEDTRAAVILAPQLQDHVTAGEPRRQCFGASFLYGRQAMRQDSSEHFDELLIAVGMLLQLRAHLGQRRREGPILERCAIAQGARLAHQHRQIVPGIIDDLIPTEVARMVSHHFVAEKHHDARSMRSHQHHPASRPRVDAVAIMVGHDQACRGGPDRFFDKTVEWSTQLHQARLLFLENLPDRPVLELQMLVALRVGDALICQPAVQLGQARDPRLGTEHLIAKIADLVLNLSLLPT